MFATAMQQTTPDFFWCFWFTDFSCNSDEIQAKTYNPSYFKLVVHFNKRVLVSRSGRWRTTRARACSTATRASCCRRWRATAAAATRAPRSTPRARPSPTSCTSGSSVSVVAQLTTARAGHGAPSPVLNNIIWNEVRVTCSAKFYKNVTLW